MLALGGGISAVQARERVGDRDGDGVADAVDECRDYAGVAPDGCPPRDSDGDQLVDGADECPARPGPTANGGCPDVDTDEDGIADRKDGCATVFGRRDYAGCPAPDRDDDGYADAEDRCPERAEVWNGVRDHDGCPDSSRAHVEVAEQRIGFVGKLGFVAGDSRLSKASGRAMKTAIGAIVAARSRRVRVLVVAEYGRSYGDSVQRARRRGVVVMRWLAAARGLRDVTVELVCAGPDGRPRVEFAYR